jgi:ankyrin repeat protein
MNHETRETFFLLRASVSLCLRVNSFYRLKEDEKLKTLKPLVALFLLLLAPLAALAAKVELKVSNPTAFDQEVTVYLYTADDKPTGKVEVGTVRAKQEKPATFTVQTKGYYKVAGVYRGVTVSEEKISVMENSLKPVSGRVELKLDVGMLDDKKAQEILAGKFSELGPERGFLPVPAPEALKTIFGALAIVLPPEKGKTSGSIQVIVSPKQFSSVMSETEFSYHSNQDQQLQSVVISGKSGASLSLPMIGNFEMQSGMENLYKLGYKLEGYGWIPKPDPGKGDWDLATAVASLTPEQIKLIKSYFTNHPGAQLLYINKVYAVKHAKFTLQKGQKLTAEVKVSVNCVITTGGVYTFDKSETSEKEFNYFILNVDGIPVYIDPDQTGLTPAIALLAAAQKGKLDEVKAILDKDPSLAKTRGENDRTPLHAAVEINNVPMIELLVAKGADVNAKTKIGNTPLHFAASDSQKEAALLLLTRNADPNLRNKAGKTPLDLALADPPNAAMATLLLTGGANPNLKDPAGKTLLHQLSDDKLVKLLLDKGADPKAIDDDGRTPLHYAATKDIAQLLLNKDADLNAKDNQDQTPLDLALAQSRVPVADFLKAKGAKSAADKPPEPPPAPEAPNPDPPPVPQP